MTRSPGVSCGRYGVRLALLAAAAVGTLAPALRAEPVRVDALQNDKKIYPEVEEGRKKLLKLDYEGALASFEAASKAHPELSNGRVIFGGMLMGLGRVRDARGQLEKAVVDTPSDADPYLIFGDLAFAEGRYTDAVLLYDKGLALAQAFKGNEERKTDLMKRSLSGAARGAERQERWDDAQKHLLALLKIDPTMGAAHYSLGHVKFELKNPKDAYASLEAAARLDEKVPSPEVTMAKFYAGVKDRDAADEWMQKAIVRASKDKEVKTRLEVGQFFLETGRLKEARAQAEDALKIAPDSEEALFLAGICSRFSKDYPKAVGYLEKAYLKKPGSLPIANQLALAQSEMGEEPTQRTLQLAEGVMRQNPNNIEAASTLGWIYFKVGELDKAERMLHAAASSAGVQPDTIYFYAKLADARNRGDTVKPMLDAALRSEAPFAYREEAQKLADQFEKRPAAPTDTAPTKSATTTPASKTGPTKATPAKDASKKVTSAKDAPAKATPAKEPAKAPNPK